ncbi:hypothetical protein BH11ACT5_BH11ACT5_20170 [soil metagenome]
MRRRSAAVAAALLVLSLAACASGGDGPAAPEETAQHAAERYLSYLADGDAASALAMIPSITDNPEKVYAGLELLSDDVLAAAASRIENPTITAEADSAGSTTTFDVTYSLAGEARNGALVLQLDGPDWVVGSADGKGALVVELVPAEGDPVPATFEIAGTTVSVAANGRPGFLLFPGVYSIRVDVDPALLVDSATPLTTSVEIGFDGQPTRVEIPVSALP